MQSLTGQREISAQSLLKFFDPLDKYLDELISKNNLQVGWKKWDPPSKKDLFPRYKLPKNKKPSDARKVTSSILLILLLQFVQF